MDFLAFLFSIVSSVAGNWVTDLIRGPRSKNISVEQMTAIKNSIAEELKNNQNINIFSIDDVADKVIEQLISLSKNPSFPLKISDSEVSLKKKPIKLPFSGVLSKWEDKEISSRLLLLDKVIKERYKELNCVDSMNHSIETIAYPAIPPILRSDFDESKKHKTGIEVDKENWKKQLSETSKVIEDRRRKELKN